ncbi:hypothetical protein [Couchioplanes caeruleus]|uniref:hypothetical protein n=1 Tax=Couchioplanes caeruleus TaxID=56438 RepID=UPI0011CE7D40|nr:hypothetical protein [Couchioplanes caeruleus]
MVLKGRLRREELVDLDLDQIGPCTPAEQGTAKKAKISDRESAWLPVGHSCRSLVLLTLRRSAASDMHYINDKYVDLPIEVNECG